MFVNRTKLKTFMYFRPHQLQIAVLVDPTKKKKHTFVDLTNGRRRCDKRGHNNQPDERQQLRARRQWTA
jgi:hypothetical protein